MTQQNMLVLTQKNQIPNTLVKFEDIIEQGK